MRAVTTKSSCEVSSTRRLSKPTASAFFKDSEKLSLIRRIAAARGILVFTDSDGAGFVIRNFLSGAVPKDQVKHCYIPQIGGKEKRKAKAGKEGLLGVEGVSDEVIIDAIRKSGATIIGEERSVDREISKADFYSLGLTGTENSAKLRQALLKELSMPTYLSTNAMLTALNLRVAEGLPFFSADSSLCRSAFLAF